MFETEDMLPRAAPRPCAPAPVGHADGIVKPTVPEVSILFGQPPQQDFQAQQQQQQQQPQIQQQSSQRPANSFAAWKQQVLPRVNFSPVLTTEIGSVAPPSSAPAVINTVPKGNDYNFLPRSRAFEAERTSPLQPAINLNRGYAMPGPSHYPRETYVNEAPSPRLSNSSTGPTDVLTICASTQTDPDILSAAKQSSSEMVHTIDKNDIREVLALLEAMRQEQHHLRTICESLVQQQQKQLQEQQHPPPSSRSFKETATQCVIISAGKGNTGVKRITPIVHDYIVEEEEIPTAALPQFQSPRGTPPVAQSTGYRTNTPQRKQSPVLPSKSNTDKTLVMNELALKYLPQKQINELMQELHVSPKMANDLANGAGSNGTPLRAIDNFSQSPSNMSNASYKYLKKYRLLPEEQMGYDHHHQISPQKTARPGSPATMQRQDRMLDLDNIRNQPKLL